MGKLRGNDLNQEPNQAVAFLQAVSVMRTGQRTGPSGITPLALGLRKALEEEPGWIVCGEAVNGRDAVAKTRALKPDVLVLDFTMPELNGLEVTRQVRAAKLQTEVVILTMHESDQLALAVLAAGARGYVFKSDAGTMLVVAVRQLLQHRPYCTVKVSPQVRDCFLHPGRSPAQPAIPTWC